MSQFRPLVSAFINVLVVLTVFFFHCFLSKLLYFLPRNLRESCSHFFFLNKSKSVIIVFSVVMVTLLCHPFFCCQLPLLRRNSDTIDQWSYLRKFLAYIITKETVVLCQWGCEARKFGVKLPLEDEEPELKMLALWSSYQSNLTFINLLIPNYYYHVGWVSWLSLNALKGFAVDQFEQIL